MKSYGNFIYYEGIFNYKEDIIMFEKIVEIAQNYLEEDMDITRETRVIQDMELSSMELFSFISDIEQECNISISESQIQKINTIGDIVDIAEA